MSGNEIERGSLIILWSEEAEYLTTYNPGKKFSSHLGILTLPDRAIWGMPVQTHQGKVFYILKPVTTDLSMRVKRKTNIVYPKEAGLMVLETGIGPGSRVIEVGTGSGALTIVLATIVGESGKVYSFDRREDLQTNAVKNVKRAGLSSRVEFKLIDTEKTGFQLKDIDAAFVDVAEPWKLVEKVWETLKPGGSWASLSPNIEQVQKTVRALKGYFARIRTYEVILRPILVREGRTRPQDRIVGHTGYITFAQKVLYFLK